MALAARLWRFLPASRAPGPRPPAGAAGGRGGGGPGRGRGSEVGAALPAGSRWASPLSAGKGAPPRVPVAAGRVLPASRRGPCGADVGVAGSGVPWLISGGGLVRGALVNVTQAFELEVLF